MTRTLIASCALFGILLASSARAQTAAPYVIETNLTLGLTASGSFAYDPSRESATQLSGMYAAFGTTLRSSYFLMPYFELAYYPIFGGSPRASGVSDASLEVLSIALGPAVDITSWLRIRGELVFYAMFLSADIDGVNVSPMRWNLGWSVAVSAKAFTWERFSLGPDVRALIISEPSIVSIVVGVAGSFDALRW